MTKKERAALVDGLTRLCADIAAIACALEGDGASRDSPTAVPGKLPDTAVAEKEPERFLPAPDADAATGTPAPNTTVTAKTPEPGIDATAETAAEEPAPEPEKVYTFEEARSILAEKARNGFRAEVKGLLAKRHAEQLSDIKDPKELAALVREAEGIGIG